jgi:small ligand-binding sensory domain FIST
VAPDEAKGFHGLRLPGTSLPGVITAGSFYNGEWLFFDVHDAERAIKIDLDHEHYAALIVEVADPDSTLRDIREAMAHGG